MPGNEVGDSKLEGHDIDSAWGVITCVLIG